MAASSEVFDTIVVGSGLAGLSAARRLTRAGQRVLVLERAKQLGGHLLPFYRYGWPFEVGVHYVADTGPESLWQRALDTIGAKVSVNPMDRAFERLFTEGSQAPEMAHLSDPEAWLAECRRRWPEHASAWGRYAADLERVWQIGYRLDFPVELTQIARLALHLPPRQSLRLLRLATLSAEDYCLGELGLSPEVYQRLSVQHLIIGCPPKRLSALLFLLINRYYLAHAGAIDGGGLALRDALLDGLDLPARTEVEVRQISPIDAPDARFAVQVGDETLRARNLIWTPDPRLLQESYQGRLGWLLRTRLRWVEDAWCLVVCYFATRQPLRHYGFANSNDYLLGDATPSENYRTADPVTLAEHNLLYISTSSIRDEADFLRHREGAGRDWGGIFQVMYLVPPDVELWGGSDPDHYRQSERQHADGFREPYRARKEAILAAIRQRLDRTYPALAAEGELTWQEVGTPLTHRRYLNSPGMNGYGYLPTRRDLLLTRPSWRTGVPGLYLAGSFLRPAHGLSAALYNGVGVAKRILAGP